MALGHHGLHRRDLMPGGQGGRFTQPFFLDPAGTMRQRREGRRRALLADGDSGKTEAEVAEPCRRRVPEAKGRAAVQAAAEPATTPAHPGRTAVTR
jgi:hypothetical protein